MIVKITRKLIFVIGAGVCIHSDVDSCYISLQFIIIVVSVIYTFAEATIYSDKT
jgi:hypothetical protein